MWLTANAVKQFMCMKTVFFILKMIFIVVDVDLFGRDEIKRKGQLMYSLNKQAIMDYDDETLQWKKKRL